MYHVSFPRIGISFDLNPVAFSLGSYDVYWYGVIISVGFMLAIFYAMMNVDRFGIDKNKLLDVIIVGLITGVVGARLYYVLFYPDDSYIRNPIAIFQIHEGGLAIYGGIIGALVGGVIVAKIKGIDIPPLLDLSALGFLIGQSIGRWGNFVNQEAFGSATNLPWGMMSENTLSQTSYPVHPCFLYESLWCALGFLVLHVFSKKFQKYSGQIFLLYVLWYGLGRFFIEAIRTDSLMLPSTSLKISQVLAFLFVVLSAVLLIVLGLKKRKLDLCGGKWMSKVMDGKLVAQKVKNDVSADVQKLKSCKIDPCLAVIIVGDDPASRIYVNNKKRACEETGIKSIEYALPRDIKESELICIINKLNNDKSVHGILVQLPLPNHINENKVIKAISHIKDVDAFSAVNVGKLMIGDHRFLPCTPAGIMELLSYYDIDVQGKNCVVVGRSNIVGKPTAMLLLEKNGTVTICHSKTKNLKQVCKDADIIVAAVGKARFIKDDMVKPGAVVIDVGINRDENNKLCGDVDFLAVKEVASYITPVPGGVGPMTIAMLLKNTVTAANIQNNM